MYDVVVEKFTFAISSPDEFLLLPGCPSFTQPSVAKHWRKHAVLTLNSGLAWSFLHSHPDV